ncbi:MAG: YbbR-like domain-containing protein [Lachnospiraceae bacterium]
MKIKEILSNNLVLKISSIVIAIVLWAVIFYKVDPAEEITIAVPIEYLNMNLVEAQNLYVSEKPSNINIIVTCRSTKKQDISASLFKAECDLAKRYGDSDTEKAVKVDVRVVENSKAIEKWEYTSSGPYVDIKVEEIVTRSISIEIASEGSLPEGYELSETGLQVTPSSVQVKGPVSALSNISNACINVDLSELTDDTTSLTANILFVDANGRRTSLSSSVECNVSTAKVSWQLLKTQTVSITYGGITGEVANGYRYSGVSIEPDSVALIGLKAALAGVHSIVIPEDVFNIEGAQEDCVFEIDITQYLPSGVTLYDKTKNMVKITVHVERLSDKTYRIPVSNIILENMNEEYEYRWSSDTITVTITGFLEDLNDYTADQIIGTLDVSELQLDCYNTVLPNIQIADGFLLKSEPIGRLYVSRVQGEASSAGVDNSMTSNNEESGSGIEDVNNEESNSNEESTSDTEENVDSGEELNIYER